MDAQTTFDDCWNRIGIQGDRSCARLIDCLHCRNCSVYTKAARSLMQRRVPDGYAEEWASSFAAPPILKQVDQHSVMIFRVGLEWLALPITCLLQIADQAPVHHLPHRSSSVLTGIVNAAGKLTAQISLAGLMKIDQQPIRDATDRHYYSRLMVLELGPHTIAVPVQELYGISRYGTTDLAPPPATVNRTVARYLIGVAKVESMQVGVLDSGLLAHTVTQALR